MDSSAHLPFSYSNQRQYRKKDDIVFRFNFFSILLPYRYRQAFIWQDKIVDYLVGLVRYHYPGINRRPRCTVLTSSMGWLGMVKCEDFQPYYDYGFICQHPDQSRGQNTQLLTTSPSLAKINVTTVGRNSNRWRPVICPSGHVTHTFLACDVATNCWAEGRVIFSLVPDSWALPTSQSCPAKMTSLPPSFVCQSEEQRVPYTLVCDHRPHCLDGSDEKFCKYSPCEWEFQFQCLNKQVRVEC